MTSIPDMTTKAPDLPFEIWHHISQFLPDQQLKRMYGVNRAFFHLSMALRYRELQIGTLDELGVRKCLFIMRYLPEMKDLIRSLTLTPVLFEFPISDMSENTAEDPAALSGTHQSTNPPRGTNVWIRFWKTLFPRQPGNTPLRPSEILRHVKRFIGTLNGVTELTIESHFNHTLIPNFACSLAFLDAGWKAFSPTLRSLTLKGEISLLGSVLEESVYLERLETLSVGIGRNMYGVDVGFEFLALVQFIARHSETLVSLEITSSELVDFGLFTRLGRLPRLQKLKIQQPRSDEYWRKLAGQDFLLRHADCITDFDWGYTNAFLPYKDYDIEHNNDETNVNPPFDLTFPNLQRFIVSGTCPGPMHLKSAIAFIGRHKETLTKLSFSSWMLSLDGFSRLVDVAASPAIKELEVGVEFLSSRVISTLAARFPSLEVLGLAYDKIGRQLVIPQARNSDMTSSIESAERLMGLCLICGFAEFKDDMETLDVGSWAVGMLNIRRCGHVQWPGHRIENVVEVIVGVLPTVGVVNGVCREQIVSGM